MFSRRTILSLLVSCSVVAAASESFAKNPHHKNGNNLLGGKLKQNGRHQVDKAGQATVSAEVNNGKVTAMTASHPQKGNLPARKVRSQRKMAEMEPGRVRVAANANDVQLAQAAVYYYAWCFDDGLDEYCYWYPADVVIVDSSWVEYVA
jgi:major membrane immunogen (membrane-anchored lipoprotein)